jgi:hypothetical protein
VTMFIQVCRELWDFAKDGERYTEKIVHSLLPELFARWRAAGARHTLTIVLISRVFYDDGERGYASGPLRALADGRAYKDFYRVVADSEARADWRPTLVDLKAAFTAFMRDILLTHHYHRAGGADGNTGARLVGQLSYAHDGPLLEALNLGVAPGERHFVDRSLALTGACTIVISPGTGVFHVDRALLRLTTTRILDSGFGVELVSIAPRPLHTAPVFAFMGPPPSSARVPDTRSADPLWAEDTEGSAEQYQFWWEPVWMSVSFWDRQMDLPFRKDRRVPSAPEWMHRSRRGAGSCRTHGCRASSHWGSSTTTCSRA